MVSYLDFKTEAQSTWEMAYSLRATVQRNTVSNSAIK